MGDIVVGPTKQQKKRLSIRVIEARGVGIVGHQDTRECLLDALYADGHLMRPEDGQDAAEKAMRRLAAGMWLREEHEKMGTRDSVTGSYAPATDTGCEEMSDSAAEAWKRVKKHLDNLPAVVRELVINVCVWDLQPRSHMLPFLRFGLDKLASMRGL